MTSPPSAGPAAGQASCVLQRRPAREDFVATLIREVGLDPVVAGPLRIARYLVPFSLAIAQLAYEGDAGPDVAYRIEGFGK